MYLFNSILVRCERFFFNMILSLLPCLISFTNSQLGAAKLLIITHGMDSCCSDFIYLVMVCAFFNDLTTFYVHRIHLDTVMVKFKGV